MLLVRSYEYDQESVQLIKELQSLSLRATETQLRTRYRPTALMHNVDVRTHIRPNSHANDMFFSIPEQTLVMVNERIFLL